MTTQEREVRGKPPRAADPAGNQRLTAMTGAVLLVLVVAECLTLLRLHRLLTVHRLLLCGALAAGLGLALATYHLSGRWGGADNLFP